MNARSCPAPPAGSPLRPPWSPSAMARSPRSTRGTASRRCRSASPTGSSRRATPSASSRPSRPGAPPRSCARSRSARPSSSPTTSPPRLPARSTSCGSSPGRPHGLGRAPAQRGRADRRPRRRRQHRGRGRDLGRAARWLTAADDDTGRLRRRRLTVGHPPEDPAIDVLALGTPTPTALRAHRRRIPPERAQQELRGSQEIPRAPNGSVAS